MELLAILLKFWRKLNRWHKALIILGLIEFEIIPQRRAGFYCNDGSLSHPYTGDTISWKLLLLLAIFLPFLVLWLTEILIFRVEKMQSNDNKRQSIKYWYKEYLFGLLLNIVLVQSLKVLVGEPRPHFFDTCKPSEAVTCKGSEYISRFTCTSSRQPSWLAESSRSFPSGHTSIGLYAALYIVWYLQTRTENVRHKYKQTIISTQIMLLLAAVLCALSRIYDRRHHWWDVLSGCGFALATLVYSVVFLCDSFSCRCIEQLDNQQLSSQQHLNQKVTS